MSEDPEVDPNVPFDPSKYLTNISGKAYLEVKWRLLWLDSEAKLDGFHYRIETELINFSSTSAIFKARVTLVDNNGVVLREVTGHGQEEQKDFGDFLEKAETKAIGRALGAAGFGTQFTGDFEFGATDGRVVDSPVGNGGYDRSSSSEIRVTRPGDAPSARQIGYLTTLLNERGSSGADVSEHLRRVEDTKANRGDKLDRITVSNWIADLTERRTIPVIEGFSPKVEGATPGDFTPELRARLLIRNDKERTVWTNVVNGLNDDVVTWRRVLSLAKTMTEDSPEPMNEAWRFTLLATAAPDSGDILDGIAIVAGQVGAESPDLEDVVSRRLAELQQGLIDAEYGLQAE